jgi:hypothetical protein
VLQEKLGAQGGSFYQNAPTKTKKEAARPIIPSENPLTLERLGQAACLSTNGYKRLVCQVTPFGELLQTERGVDLPGGVGFVQRVEVDAGDRGVEQLGALLGGVVNARPFHSTRIVLG